MSDAFSGVGSKFYMGSSVIAEINSISGPNLTRDTIDVTSLDSTDGYREFIGGFRDGGELSLSMNFTQAGFELLKANLDDTNNTLEEFDIVLDEGGTKEATFSCDGLVSSIGMAVPMDDKITCDVTIKISGVVSIESGKDI